MAYDLSKPYHVGYESVDSYGEVKWRSFKDPVRARAYAEQLIGATPTLGGHYAVSDDGIGKVMVEGMSIRELFPRGF